MDQDLNISPALASIFQVVKRINRLVTENRIYPPDARRLLDAFQKIDTVLKIFDFGQAAENERVQALLKDRQKGAVE